MRIEIITERTGGTQTGSHDYATVEAVPDSVPCGNSACKPGKIYVAERVKDMVSKNEVSDSVSCKGKERHHPSRSCMTSAYIRIEYDDASRAISQTPEQTEQA